MGIAKRFQAGATGLLAAVLAGCGPVEQASPVSTVNVPFVPDVSINEIMVGQVDHAARFVFDVGINPDQQLLANAWQELEHHAIQLVSATSAITMGGAGENDATWVAQSGWREYTRQFNEASLMALQAARAQDLMSVRAAGEMLAGSCDGCHQQYKPDIPTQGFYRAHDY